MNKKAVLGQGVLTLKRIFIVSLIVFVMFGISAIFYRPYIDIRHAEAQLLVHKIIECLFPKAALDNQIIAKAQSQGLFNYCNISNTKRYYIELTLLPSHKKITSGNENLVWIQNFMEQNKEAFADLQTKKQIPGYFHSVYKLPDKTKFSIKAIVAKDE